MVSAIDEIPAALLKTLDSGTVRNIVAALLIPLPHGMTAPCGGGGKRAKKNRGCAPVLGKRITQLLEDVADGQGEFALVAAFGVGRQVFVDPLILGDETQAGAHVAGIAEDGLGVILAE